MKFKRVVQFVAFFISLFALNGAKGQGIVQMNFEPVTDFSLTFSPWTVSDVDGDSTYGIENHIFLHNSEPMAYIAFNPAMVTPAMTDPGIQPHGGSRFGACFSSPAGANDDWFISPKVQLKYNGEFSFWEKAYTNEYGPEKYKVGISTTTNDPSAFVFLSGVLPLNADTAWTKKTFNLSDYENQEVYLAIQCVSNNAFIFMIDDLEVDPGDTTEQLPSSALLDFELIPDFSLTFNQWTVADINGGSTYGIDSVEFPNNYSPMAYICFNQSKTTPPLFNMPAHTGSKFGACFSSEPPKNPNNKWLISPKMRLEANAKLGMWVQTHNSLYGLEKYKVYVSTTGTNPSDFTAISGPVPESAPVNWTRRTYDLANYANQQVYVAIQCVTDNGFIFMVDDIEISSHVGMNETAAEEPYQVYPNPASDRIFIDAGTSPSRGVNITLVDGFGRIVFEQSNRDLTGVTQVNLPDLLNGVYCLVIRDHEGIISKKIIINK